jgi:thiamine-monophosphate kinase
MVDRPDQVNRAPSLDRTDAEGFTEDELVATIRKILAGEGPGVRLGIGDDAALVDVGDRLDILTTDLLVEDVHFRRDGISPRDLGYKAIAVNVSDIAAMGGSPRYGLVSVALPRDVAIGWVVELYGGVRDASAEYAMTVVGGDTSLSDRIVLSVTVTGEVAKDGAVTRAGARPGDRLVVTGALGASAGGLRLAEADPEAVRSAVGSEWARELVAAHVRPQARVGEGQTLAQAGATAMMDLSDGLAIDLGRLCRESAVGAAVELARIPVAPGLAPLAGVLPIDPLQLALSGGEDYELLAALPPHAVGPATSKIRERFGTPLTEVGEIRREEGLVAVLEDGSERPLEPTGWDHFGG